METLVPHAIVIDAAWKENGKTAWFEPSSDQWIEYVRPLLLGLDGDTLLTVVDCHC